MKMDESGHAQRRLPLYWHTEGKIAHRELMLMLSGQDYRRVKKRRSSLAQTVNSHYGSNTERDLVHRVHGWEMIFDRVCK